NGFDVLGAHKLADVLQVAFLCDVRRMFRRVGQGLAHGIGQRQAVENVGLERGEARAKVLQRMQLTLDLSFTFFLEAIEIGNIRHGAGPVGDAAMITAALMPAQSARRLERISGTECFMSEVEGVGPQALPGLREQVARIIEEASRQGASACEVSVSMEQGLSTTVRQREVETVEFNRDQGFGITLYVGQRKGSASTTGSGEEAIRETVAAALAIARHASEDEFAGLADPALMATEVADLDLYHPWGISPDEAVELALSCEAAAFAADKRILNADGTTLSTHRGCRGYGNSNGFIGAYSSSRHSLGCVMIAESEGQMQRDYHYDVSRVAS